MNLIFQSFLFCWISFVKSENILAILTVPVYSHGAGFYALIEELSKMHNVSFKLLKVEFNYSRG